MAEVGSGIQRVIQDADGEVATVTNNKLDVNATIQAGDLNVGNVDIQLAGTTVSGNSGVVDGGTLRVTLAADDALLGLLIKSEDGAHSSGHAGVLVILNPQLLASANNGGDAYAKFNRYRCLCSSY